MKIYIAAPWAERDKMPAIATLVEAKGHTLTHRWWEFPDAPENANSWEYLRNCAIQDVEGVLDADVVLLINSQKSEGKAVEQGIAIASGKEIVAVGELGALSKNVFHYLDNYYWTPTVESALELMDELDFNPGVFNSEL